MHMMIATITNFIIDSACSMRLFKTPFSIAASTISSGFSKSVNTDFGLFNTQNHDRDDSLLSVFSVLPKAYHHLFVPEVSLSHTIVPELLGQKIASIYKGLWGICPVSQKSGVILAPTSQRYQHAPQNECEHESMLTITIKLLRIMIRNTFTNHLLQD